MAGYTTEQIRTVALAGQAGAGKTTLVEALLQHAGALTSAGSVDRGDTVCDYDALEQRYHHSLSPSVVSLEHRDSHINLVDTPGYPDFLGQTLEAMTAADTAAVVVNAQSGIETMTRRMMDWAGEQGMARMLIVNRIDAQPGRLAGLYAEIREVFGGHCLALNLPREHGAQVADCLSHAAGEADIDSVAAAHTALLDQVVEVDESLMERYLEGEEPSGERLHAPFERALREGHLVPVVFTSARSGAGVAELLEVLSRWAPNPLEASPHVFLRGYGTEARALTPSPAPDQPLLAHVFRVEFDPYAGKLAMVRVHRGTLRKGHQVLVDDGAASFKPAHLFRIQGREHIEVEEAVAGDLCAVTKVDSLHFDAVLHADHDDDALHPRPLRFPMPLAGLALQPRRRGDEHKVSDILGRLAAEDPCLRIEHDMTANETVLRGLGDLHLKVALEKMKARYHLEVDTHPPSVPYRETVTRVGQGHCRHKKQTGGAGQFGEVYLRVEPLAAGAGFEFADEVTGGAIPAPLIPAVEKGVRQVLASGVIAGYPLQDLRVVVTDGKHHPVDSKEVAFVTAGRKAFREAVAAAAPVVLEPYVELDVTAGSDHVGDLTADLSARRARISRSLVHSDGRTTVTAQTPLAELNGYAARLKAITGGEGTWSLQFSHYEPAPPALQKSLTGAHKPAAEG